MKDIEVVVFDIGGVLVDLNYERCVESLQAIGFAEARDFVSCYHPSSFFGDLERGEISRATFCDKIREAASISASDEDICRAYSSILETIPLAKLRMMESLRKRGYRVYALSNMSEVMFPVVCDLMKADGHSVEYYFDSVFVSYKLGVMKPSEQIYDIMLSEIGVAPEKILFIDDGEQNVIAAQRKGIQTYLAAPKENFASIFE